MRAVASAWVAIGCLFTGGAGCSGKQKQNDPHVWRKIDGAFDAAECLVSHWAVEAAAVLPNAGGVVVGFGDSVQVIGADGQVLTLASGRGAIAGIALSPGGVLCARGGTGGEVDVWDTAGWKHVANRKFAGNAECLGFTSDGKNIVLARGMPVSEVVVVDAARLEDVSTPVSKSDRWLLHTAYNASSNSLAFYYPDTGELQYVNVVSKATHTVAKLSSPPRDLAIAGGNVLIVTGEDVQIVACDSGKTITTAHVDGWPATTVAAGDSAGLFVVGHGSREKQPCKLVVRSSKTGKECLELDYPRGLGRIWFDSDQRIVIGRCLGELLRWKLPERISCE